MEGTSFLGFHVSVLGSGFYHCLRFAAVILVPLIQVVCLLSVDVFIALRRDWIVVSIVVVTFLSGRLVFQSAGSVSSLPLRGECFLINSHYPVVNPL